MSGIDDLKAAVTSLKVAVDANTASTNNEIAVVNTVINALKGGGLTDADAEQLAQTLAASVGNLQSSQTALDSEAQSIQPPA